jgi:hypothetical protein
MKLFYLIGLLVHVSIAQPIQHPWLNHENLSTETVKNIPCFDGFMREKVDSGSFADWLRNLPLKEATEKVRLFNNHLKSNQTVHYRIIDIDVGNKDLQQCSDAVIRLRAEYLYHLNNHEKIHFNFTSGDEAKFTEWINGQRPSIKNDQVTWKNIGTKNSGYSSFRKYLETVFIYSGSYSLKKELVHISNCNNIDIGDVFIQGGFPGHAVIVADKSVNPESGKIAVLLAQSYMPAQDIHILKNLNEDEINPWYIVRCSNNLYTPEWTFEWNDLYKFK